MKLFKFIFLALVIAILFATEQYYAIGMIGFGAVVTGNVLGKVAGKIGQIVGFDWKGIDVFRSYVIPTNPQTTEQQTHRLNFKSIVQFSSYFLASIIQPYWTRFAIKMSEFNAFVKENSGIDNFASHIDSVVMSKGNLFGPNAHTCTVDASDGTAAFVWDDANGPNGLATDLAVLVTYYAKTQEINIKDGDYTRADAAGSVDIEGLEAGETVYTWLFFYRLDEYGVPFVSNSTSLKKTVQA